MQNYSNENVEYAYDDYSKDIKNENWGNEIKAIIVYPPIEKTTTNIPIDENELNVNYYQNDLNIDNNYLNNIENNTISYENNVIDNNIDNTYENNIIDFNNIAKQDDINYEDVQIINDSDIDYRTIIDNINNNNYQHSQEEVIDGNYFNSGNHTDNKYEEHNNDIYNQNFKTNEDIMNKDDITNILNNYTDNNIINNNINNNFINYDNQLNQNNITYKNYKNELPQITRVSDENENKIYHNNNINISYETHINYNPNPDNLNLNKNIISKDYLNPNIIPKQNNDSNKKNNQISRETEINYFNINDAKIFSKSIEPDINFNNNKHKNNFINNQIVYNNRISLQSEMPKKKLDDIYYNQITRESQLNYMPEIHMPTVDADNNIFSKSYDSLNSGEYPRNNPRSKTRHYEANTYKNNYNYNYEFDYDENGIDQNIFQQYLLFKEFEENEEIIELKKENKKLKKNIYKFEKEKKLFNKEKELFLKMRDQTIRDNRKNEENLKIFERELEQKYKEKKNEIKIMMNKLKEDKRLLEQERLNMNNIDLINSQKKELKDKEMYINMLKKEIQEKEQKINELKRKCNEYKQMLDQIKNNNMNNHFNNQYNANLSNNKQDNDNHYNDNQFIDKQYTFNNQYNNQYNDNNHINSNQYNHNQDNDDNDNKYNDIQDNDNYPENSLVDIKDIDDYPENNKNNNINHNIISFNKNEFDNNNIIRISKNSNEKEYYYGNDNNEYNSDNDNDYNNKNIKDKFLYPEDNNNQNIQKRKDNELIVNQYNPCVGLFNIENPNYMNAIIQCFAHIPEITDAIVNIHLDPNFEHKPSYYLEFLKNYRSVLINIFFPERTYNFNKNPIKPIQLRNSLYSLNPEFKENENIKIKDFIDFFINRLHEELNVKNEFFNKSKNKKNINMENENEVLIEYLEDFTSNNNSYISKYLYGINKSTLYCHECQKTFFNFGHFSYLYFNLSKVLDYKINKYKKDLVDLNLMDCLDYYQKTQTLLGDNGLLCPVCNHLTESTAINNIYSTKEVLIFYFEKDENNEDNFNFDFNEIINLTDYIQYKRDGEKNKEKFFLTGIVNFSENNYGKGKYKAFCNMSKNNVWYCYDNENVYPVDFKDIKTNGFPILLFYHKMPNK